MNSKQFEELLKKKNLLEVYNVLKENIKEHGFNVVEFAEKCGLTIYNAKMEKNISGSLEGNEILVNKAHSIGRRRFTAAHEIAHHVLGHGDREDRIFYRKEDINNQDYKIEVQANQFAANLLMPEDLFKEKYNSLMKENDEETVHFLLAEFFNVSFQAVQVRAISLKLDNAIWMGNNDC